MLILPCCYFPTSVFIIDDNNAYLHNLSLLIPKNIPTILETNPLNVQYIVETNYLRQDILSDCVRLNISSECEESNTLEFFNLDLNQLINIRKNPKRFSFISLLLIDYSMPSMTGINLCEQLRHIPIKKAIITGEADLQIAVNAFNSGIIDRFILKNTPHFHEVIQKAINELQREYFIELSKGIMQNLKMEKLLNNSHFVYFLKRKMQRLNAIEFYLLDTHGSVLFLDSMGNPFIIAVKSADEIKRYYHIAVDNNGSENITDALLTRKKFPFLLNEKQLKAPVDEWDSLLYDAKRIPNISETYYIEIDTVNCMKYFSDDKVVGIESYLYSKNSRTLNN